MPLVLLVSLRKLDGRNLASKRVRRQQRSSRPEVLCDDTAGGNVVTLADSWRFFLPLTGQIGDLFLTARVPVFEYRETMSDAGIWMSVLARHSRIFVVGVKLKEGEGLVESGKDGHPGRPDGQRLVRS